MKAYSLDLRERIVRAVAQGMPKAAAARVFAVSLATVKNYAQQVRRTGSLNPKPIPGRPAKIPPAQDAEFVAQLRSAPDATLGELGQAWAQSHPVTPSTSALWRTIKRVGWTRKKRLWVPASATNRPVPPGAPI